MLPVSLLIKAMRAPPSIHWGAYSLLLVAVICVRAVPSILTVYSSLRLLLSFTLGCERAYTTVLPLGERAASPSRAIESNSSGLRCLPGSACPTERVVAMSAAPNRYFSFIINSFASFLQRYLLFNKKHAHLSE